MLRCIARTPLIAKEASRRPGEEHTLAFPTADPVPLKGERRLGLTVSFNYEIYDTGATGSTRWRVKTRGYKHQIVIAEDFTEVALFHWHPREQDGEYFSMRPHAYVGPGLLLGNALITRKAHVPSGRVALEDVIEFAIRDLAVVPQRDDWQQIINETRGLFEQYRTWGGRGYVSCPSCGQPSAGNPP